MTSTGPASLRVSRRTQRTATFGACLLLGVAAWLTPATAARSALGATMRARSLKLADAKGTAALFAGDAVSAVLLFTPDHVPSNEALDAAERCRTALGEAPVRWLALVSDRYTRADLQQTLARPGRMLNVAFDGGDEVYAELKVAVRPTAAVIDRSGRLVDWQPYTTVGFGDKLCARVRHAAGLLDDAGLDAVLNPRRADRPDPDMARAQRYLKLAERLFATGKLDLSEDAVRKALAAHEPVAAAHTLLGTILKARGDCPAALVAFERALALAPNEPAAIAGRAACRKE